MRIRPMQLMGVVQRQKKESERWNNYTGCAWDYLSAEPKMRQEDWIPHELTSA